MKTYAKKIFRIMLSVVFFSLLFAAGSWDKVSANLPKPSELIHRAGSSDDDAERLAILKELREIIKHDPDAVPGLSLSDTEKMIYDIERWIDSSYRDPSRRKRTAREKGYLRQFFYDAHPFEISEESPLYPIMCLYKGRARVWELVEKRKETDEKRQTLLSQAADYFKTVNKAFPENRTARMYLGEPIPWPHDYPSHPNAPDWANWQRKSLEGLTDIIHWWIDNRLRSDGQFGGGWGDDCEMWRWWTPVMIGFDDPEITKAQETFSNALLSQEHMTGGYSNIMSDVEHSAEDTADTITPMLHLQPDESDWQQKALGLSELMESKWTGINKQGLLQFKSTFFTVEGIDTSAEYAQRACDTVYHPRAVQPALLLWQRTGDEKLTRLFTAWMDTWVDAAAGTERGKPGGILPSAIHWPDGLPGGDNSHSKDWWNPKNYKKAKLYAWPSDMGIMNDTLLLTYYMTGDEKYLAPLRSMAEIWQTYLENPVKHPDKGSAAWCASKMKFLIPTLMKYRVLTGDTRYDRLIADSGGYKKFLITGNKNSLIKPLRKTAKAMSHNFEGFTREVRYTDRVLRLPKKWFKEMGLKGKESPDTELLFSMITGEPGEMLYFPMNAVRWLTTSREIAAMVTRSDRGHFTAELFHFGKKPRSMGAEFYLLNPGEYEMILLGQGGKERVRQKISVKGRRTRAEFELPPQQLVELRIEAFK